MLTAKSNRLRAVPNQCAGKGCVGGQGRTSACKSTPGNQPAEAPSQGVHARQGSRLQESCQYGTEPGRCGSEARGTAYAQGCASFPNYHFLCNGEAAGYLSLRGQSQNKSVTLLETCQSNTSNFLKFGKG